MVNANSIWQKLEELLNIYEGYLFFHNDSRLSVIIEQNSFSFYLFDEEKEDNFIIDFDEKDKNTFRYLVIKIILKLFGNVLIYFDGVTIYNIKYKNNIKINVLNEDIKKIVERIISVQESEFINDDNKIVKELKNSARRIYPRKFMKILSDRVDISKKYLQSR